jgi:sortase A
MKLRKINNILMALIVLINLFLITAPLYPKVYLWWQLHVDHRKQKLERLVKASKPSKGHSPAPQMPEGERLIIPKIAIDASIVEGSTIAAANSGVWHRPHSSSPNEGGNTVLAGHRFTYTDPRGIFYSLDKLSKGDTVAVWWGRQEYTYEVSDTKVVPPTDTSVEDPSTDKRLTLYTCTPLWSAKNRLVVTALRRGP